MIDPALTRHLQSLAALVAMRLPLSWIQLTVGAPVSVDGQTLDTRTQWLLTLFQKSGRQPLEQRTVPDARAEYDATIPLLSGAPPPIGEIVDRAIPGPGGPIPVRIYRPQATSGRALPAMLFLHGGGWTIGSLDGYDAPCRFLAARIGCIVVSVGYRLAPEHKFPAAVDDALAAWRWLADGAAALGADPKRLLVAGDSAGGALAATIAQETRADPVKPAMQVLVYPALDLSMDTKSYASFGSGFLLTRAGMEWFRNHYLNDLSEIDDPRASPGKATDLAGVAPAMIVTAGFDPLRDEGRAYADRLQAAGVKTIYRDFEGLVHGFFAMRGTVQGAARALDEIVAGLRHELAQLA